MESSLKNIKSLTIIMGTLFIGVILRALIPLPIPESVYGMLLLFIFLKLGIVKLDTISEVSAILLSFLSFVFLPPSVGLMDSYFMVKDQLVGVVVVIFLSTILTMAASGLTVKLLKEKRRVY